MRFSFVYLWSPRRLFLVDALGALLTSSMLGLGLVQFNGYFLVSKTIFYILAAYAALLCIYSTSIYLIKPVQWVPYLRRIASANAAYCVFTFTLILLVSETVSTLGIVYFSGEAAVILTIAYIEWTFARKNSAKPFTKV